MEEINDKFRTVRGYQLLHANGTGLTSALEDYMEMAYRLCKKDGYTRVGKLSEHLHVRPSSASKMILKLIELDLLQYDGNDSIVMTDKGAGIGKFLLNRHDQVARFLSLVGIENALPETEMLEHCFTESTVNQLSRLLTFFEENPEIKRQWNCFNMKE